MLDFTTNIYDRSALIGRPNLTLKDVECKNITCGKKDKFKKYKDNIYLCECGYQLRGEFEIETQHKISFYCKAKKGCPEGKTKMNKECLRCKLIGER